jgi:predicted nucleic acid-binding protein
MSVVSDIPATSWAAEFEHSEALDAVMAALSTMHQLNASVGTFLQVHAIVDTNIIYADILALVRRAENDRKRPAVLELLAKRTIIGYFPREKLTEVHEKCLELSSRYGIAPNVVTDLWLKYQKHLKVVPTLDLERERVDSQTLAARDPTDLPFLQARHIVGASVVLSNDPDLHASGAPVMPWSRVLLDLRHHSRKEGLKAAIFVGTTTAVVVPIAALIGCVRLIYNAAKKIPPNVWIIAAVGFGIALLIPQSRKFLIDSGKSALGGLKSLGANAGPFVGHALEVATHAGQEADNKRPALEKKLARALRRRITLTQAVYRACLLASRPLTVAEVWTAALRDGAKSKARSPLTYVLRALKRHPLLRRLPDGRWEIVPDLTTS